VDEIHHHLEIYNIIRIVEDKIETEKEDPEDNLTLIEQKLNEWKNGENVGDIEEFNKELSALKLENDRETTGLAADG